MAAMHRMTLGLLCVAAASCAVHGQAPELEFSTLSADSYALVRYESSIRLTGLPAQVGATSVDLSRFEVFGRGCAFVAQTVAGPERLPAPQLALFRSPRGAAIRAYLSISASGVYGFVQTPERQFVVSTGPTSSPLPIAIADLATLPPAAESPPYCTVGVNEFIAPDYVAPEGGSIAGGAPPCRRAQVAVETDNEYFFETFDGNANAANAYVGTLMGAVSEIYERDLNVTIEVSHVNLWLIPDPWDRPNSGSQLIQFRDYWDLYQTGVERDIAHYLSGRLLGGGVAYLGGLCSDGANYGLSGNLNGWFPYPLVNNHGANWDPMVVAHEIGHNFGGPHTHQMSPPVDCCGGGYIPNNCGGTQNCSNASNGTIMSYCHVCPGGMSNIRLEFHPRTVQERMLPFLAQLTACDLSCPLLGDMNCDGVLNNFDLDPFVLALTSRTVYVAEFPNCRILNADANGDGVVNNFDIDAFVDLLVAP